MFFSKKYSLFLIFLFLCLFSVDAVSSSAQDAPAAEEKTAEKKSEPKSGLIIEKGESSPSSPAAEMREKMELPKGGTFEVACTVISVSQPVNPRETIMVMENSDGKEFEAILAPATGYYPHDYYPREGDLVKASCAVAGVFNKKVFAYSISLINENPASGKKSK